MTARTMKVRETLRALGIVTLYMFGAAAIGSGLALVADANVAALTMGAL